MQDEENKIIYNVNRGVGRPLDFYGLKEQYIIFFVGGVFIGLILFMVIQMFSKLVAGIVAGIILLLAYCGCFYLNSRFGVHGLTKEQAMKSCPTRIKMNRIGNLIDNRNKK